MSLAAAGNSHQDIRYWKKTTQMPSFYKYVKLFMHLPPQCSLLFCDLKKDVVELERVQRRVSR